LAAKDWHLAFTVYLLPAVSLMLIASLRGTQPAPEPPHSDQMRQTKIKVGHLMSLTLLYFVITMTSLVITFYLSFLVEHYRFPQSVSSPMISLFFLAIMLPGFVLNTIIRYLRSATIFISLVAMVVGLLLVGTVPDIPLMIVGVILTGTGYGILQPIIYDKAATNAPPHLSTLALSIVMSVNYAAILVAPFIIDGVDHLFHTTSHRFAFMFNAAITILLAIAAAILYRHNRVLGSDD
jgi:MFS family permease